MKARPGVELISTDQGSFPQSPSSSSPLGLTDCGSEEDPGVVSLLNGDLEAGQVMDLGEEVVQLGGHVGCHGTSGVLIKVCDLQPKSVMAG